MAQRVAAKASELDCDVRVVEASTPVAGARAVGPGRRPYRAIGPTAGGVDGCIIHAILAQHAVAEADDSTGSLLRLRRRVQTRLDSLHGCLLRSAAPSANRCTGAGPERQRGTSQQPLPRSGPRVVREQWSHEAPLVSHDASALIADLVSRDELWVLPEEPTVLLVRGEAGEAKQRKSLVAGALSRKIVAVMRSAMLIDELDPATRELLERNYLCRVDRVVNDTGDHHCPLMSLAPSLRVSRGAGTERESAL